MVSALCLVILATSHGFVGIWIALTIYMSLRMVAGFWRSVMVVFTAFIFQDNLFVVPNVDFSIGFKRICSHATIGFS